MITAGLEQFLINLPKSEAIMGLDLGTKTIGIAVSDNRE